MYILFGAFLRQAREEEQTSLSTEKNNHYFDSFTNSYDARTVEDKRQDAAPQRPEL